MPSNKTKVRRALQRASSRHLWCAIPLTLEDYIVTYASSVLDDADICDSSHGPLFQIAADCAHWHHAGLLDLVIFSPYSQGLSDPFDDVSLTVATVYDALVKITHHGTCRFYYGEDMSDDESNRWCKEGHCIL